MEAITEGMRSAALQKKLAELEQRQEQTEQDFAAPPPSQIRLPPNLADLYRQKLSHLRDTLTKIAEGHPINKIDALMPWKME